MPSSDRNELPLLVLNSTLHNPLRSPVVNPQCFGGSVDQCAVTACSQHCDHSLSRGCVVTPDAISSDARSASTCAALISVQKLLTAQPGRPGRPGQHTTATDDDIIGTAGNGVGHDTKRRGHSADRNSQMITR